MVKMVKMARNILPSEVTVQIPPNLSDFFHLVKAGARDLGGISQITPDFINPEAPWPSIESIRQTLKDSSFILKERLPIYPRYVVEGWYPDNLSSLIEKMSDKGGYRKCLI
jgi:FO synthase subunit 1